MKTENGKTTGVSSSAGMSLERFAELAEAYGGEIDRWPEGERFAALSLAGRSEEARTLLADAHGLDFLLSRVDTPPDPSPALRERMASLEAHSGRIARPGFDVSDSIDPAGVSPAAMPRAGLSSFVRSNALMLSVVVNVVLAGAVGGLWIAPFFAPGPGSGMTYVEFEEALVEELGDDPAFDEETPEDFAIASWPDVDRVSDDEISAI